MKIPYIQICKAIDICRDNIKHLQNIDHRCEALEEQLEYLYIACEALERHIPRPPEYFVGPDTFFDDNAVPCLGCPTCDFPIDFDNIKHIAQHCPVCGQVIDFEGFKK